MTARTTLILGGARSGKSSHALKLATEAPNQVLFVATAKPSDAEMADRIQRHQKERPQSWRTLEAPTGIAHRLDQIETPATVIVDCITILVSNVLETISGSHDLPVEKFPEAEALVKKEIQQLVEAMGRHRARWILVTNEVGEGIVPVHPLARFYRDLLGRANQTLAAACDEVLLMVAGVPLRVKGNP